MKESILLYQFTDAERAAKVKKALLVRGFRLRVVKPEEYLEPVGLLAGDKSLPPSGKIYEGAGFEREMLVMAGLSSARIDTVIAALRKAGVGRVDYKAVLTPVNRTWDSLKLYREIAREHEAMSGAQQAAENRPEPQQSEPVQPADSEDL